MYQILMTSIWASLRLFWNNLLPLSYIILPFVVVLEVIGAYFVSNYDTDELLYQDLWPLLILKFIIQPFYSIAIIFYLYSIISGKPLSVIQSWIISLSYWFRFALLSLCIYLLIAIGFLLVYLTIPQLSFLAVVIMISGIILFVRITFAQFYLLLENNKVIESIKLSLHATKQYIIVLLLGYMILAVIIYMPYLTISNNITGGSNDFNVLNILISIIFEILALLFVIFTYRIYHIAQQHDKN